MEDQQACGEIKPEGSSGGECKSLKVINYDEVSVRRIGRQNNSSSHTQRDDPNQFFGKSSLDELPINRDNMVFRSRDNNFVQSQDGGSIGAQNPSLDQRSLDEVHPGRSMSVQLQPQKPCANKKK